MQDIFRMTPHQKQVMMFSATLSKDIRPVCKKFMQSVRRDKYLLLVLAKSLVLLTQLTLHYNLVTCCTYTLLVSSVLSSLLLICVESRLMPGLQVCVCVCWKERVDLMAGIDR